MSLEPTLAGPQTDVSVTPEPTPPVAPQVLSDEQRALLRAVCNRIVPAHGTVAGAGDLDVASSIERTLAESARLRRLFLDGLALIEITAQRRSGMEFGALQEDGQVAVLESVEQSAPAFFTALVEHTYRGYYTLRTVHARPPQPIGYELPPFDPSLLDTQRQRAPFWRRVKSTVSTLWSGCASVLRACAPSFVAS
jgi:hypothetical protein